MPSYNTLHLTSRLNQTQPLFFTFCLVLSLTPQNACIFSIEIPTEMEHHMVMGKSRKQRKSSNHENKKTWVTNTPFEEWPQWFDRHMKGRRVFFLVDMAPTHAVFQLK